MVFGSFPQRMANLRYVALQHADLFGITVP
jgi:hypothetical protein